MYVEDVAMESHKVSWKVSVTRTQMFNAQTTPLSQVGAKPLRAEAGEFSRTN